jgi:hypothetical protein
MYANLAKTGGQLTSVTDQSGMKDSGFFGQLKDIGLGVLRQTSELAPVWAKQQLYEQQEDQLQRVIFDPEGYPRAVWQPGAQTYEAVNIPRPKTGSGLNQVMFNIGGYPVTSGGLLAMSAALLVTMVIAKRIG